MLATQVAAAYDKAVAYCQSVRQYSISPGNFAGGLTTIEEKSLGALAKSGSRPIQGVIKVGQSPPWPGLWLLDTVPDPHFMQFGYTNPNDTEGIMDLISVGSQILLFVTGRGSVIGSPVGAAGENHRQHAKRIVISPATSTSTPAVCSPASARSTNSATNSSR